MKCVDHPSCNMTLGSGGLPNVRTVTATLITNEDDSFNSIATFWKPSPKELALLNANGFVTLYVCGTSHPPVTIEVNP